MAGDSIHIRLATLEDVGIVARHRAEMFRDMGTLGDERYDEYVEMSRRWVHDAMLDGSYVGWLASPAPDVHGVIAGAGVILRPLPPFPMENAIGYGPQALIVNVFTERAWRQRGVAERLMRHLLAWIEEHDIMSVVLHASAEGRPLYEKLGFRQTSEMRLHRG